MTRSSFTRRDFLKSTSAAAAAVSTGAFTGVATANSLSANEKLSIACVGTANRALADINGVAGENIVAFCDVDSNFRNGILKRFKDARGYTDYREMIDTEKEKIDAVVVGCADHNHAPASLRAIQAGKHCYCEKPLTHTVHEARVIAEAAKKHGVATQLGTQIHAGENYRRVTEMIQSGVIGNVTDVHVWVGKGWGYRKEWDGSLSGKGEAVPETLDWDLWLGPAQEYPFYKGRFHPAQWRRWWEFGQGTLGDMACHYLDLPFWALGLRHPVRCEAEGPEVHPEMCPVGLTVRYVFPGGDSPINLTWYDGNQIPKSINGQRVPPNGVMFVGSEGMMFADYNNYRLFPQEKFKNYKPPKPTIPRSIGHHAEWIKACKDGSATTCNFDYSGALTETVLLGNVAFRTGKSLEWDAKNLKATNAPEADKYVRKEYRKGWEVA